MVFQAVKCNYFSILIASAYNQSATLFKMSCFLLEKEDTEVYLKGYAEEFTNFLEDKIISIHSQLYISMVSGLVEAPGADS